MKKVYVCWLNWFRIGESEPYKKEIEYIFTNEEAAESWFQGWKKFRKENPEKFEFSEPVMFYEEKTIYEQY